MGLWDCRNKKPWLPLHAVLQISENAERVRTFLGHEGVDAEMRRRVVETNLPKYLIQRVTLLAQGERYFDPCLGPKLFERFWGLF